MPEAGRIFRSGLVCLWRFDRSGSDHAGRRRVKIPQNLVPTRLLALEYNGATGEYDTVQIHRVVSLKKLDMDSPASNPEQLGLVFE